MTVIYSQTDLITTHHWDKLLALKLTGWGSVIFSVSDYRSAAPVHCQVASQASVLLCGIQINISGPSIICEKFWRLGKMLVMLTCVMECHVDHPQVGHHNIPPLLLGHGYPTHSHRCECHNRVSRKRMVITCIFSSLQLSNRSYLCFLQQSS